MLSVHITAARSTALRSSRTLPGQAWRRSTSSAAAENRGEGSLQVPPRRRQERGGEQLDLLRPLAQGRDDERDAVEPEVEIGAQAALPTVRFHVSVGGGTNAHVDGTRAGRAEARHHALLENAQQLGLSAERQLADLVEKHRAAGGGLEQPGPGQSAGERALLAAEQLALEQRVGERRAVDAHEGPLRPRRVRVDGPRQDLLPDAGLAQ